MILVLPDALRRRRPSTPRDKAYAPAYKARKFAVSDPF
ncbi:hypothetical protein BXY66_0187 [Shimia isoporae]|uniref:Uncharacterized protein n=1 Tax=Shimia isoporae TaxID=647720 RepID=A0A4R1NJ30_9RHOB|nr:hypothetical protein BXY66_0187 [Shimia isoporae]